MPFSSTCYIRCLLFHTQVSFHLFFQKFCNVKEKYLIPSSAFFINFPLLDFYLEHKPFCSCLCSFNHFHLRILHFEYFWRQFYESILIAFFAFSCFRLSWFIGIGLLSFVFFPSLSKESASPLESLESACKDLLNEGKLLVVDLLHDWSPLGIFTTGLQPKPLQTHLRRDWFLLPVRSANCWSSHLWKPASSFVVCLYIASLF